MPTVTKLEEGFHAIDLDFQGMPGVIAAYVMEDAGERAIVEIGPSSTFETLLAGLRELQVEPESIDKILVTHIHLDHAGASGSFMRRFPRARLFVHEVGAPHMVNPEKLVASATRIYGDMMGPLWGEMLPVPEERMTVLTDGDTVTVGSRALDVLYTPGHASHHVVFHDAERAGLIAGDAAACRIQGHQYVRPPTPPPDIDLALWSQSLQRICALQPRTIYLTHFGPYTDVERHLRDVESRLHEWAEIVEKAVASGQDRPEITDNLRLHADGELMQETDEAKALEQYELAAPYGMSVDGLIRYLRKRA